jgi:hypothetical protein
MRDSYLIANAQRVAVAEERERMKERGIAVSCCVCSSFSRSSRSCVGKGERGEESEKERRAMRELCGRLFCHVCVWEREEGRGCVLLILGVCLCVCAFLLFSCMWGQGGGKAVCMRHVLSMCGADDSSTAPTLIPHQPTHPPQGPCLCCRCIPSPPAALWPGRPWA